MLSINKLRKLSFLVYGLGSTGKSVVNFFRRNDIKEFEVWDDKNKDLYKFISLICILDRYLKIIAIIKPIMNTTKNENNQIFAYKNPYIGSPSL